jgi:hypothetical protein
MSRKPLDIEIIAHVVGSMKHCNHCQVFIDGVGVGDQIHRENVQSYPEDFIHDWQRLSGWVLDLAEAFPGQLVIRITDAQSLRGLWKALTQRARQYPTFIIEGRETYHGWDREHLDQRIRERLVRMAG